MRPPVRPPVRPPARRGRPAFAALVAVALALGAGCGAASPPESGPAVATVAPPPVGAPLELGPFAPQRPELFGPPYYPDTPKAAAASGGSAEAGPLLEEAERLVGARGADLAEQARRLFADPDLRALVPEPRLRAAAVSLLGTIAEPAIDWLRESDRFARVEFGDLGGPELAKSLEGPGDRRRIVVASRLASERPALLSVVLAHEALHADGEVGDAEELVATAFQALVHMEQLLAEPALAGEITELAQSVNAWTLIRLNTRAPGSPTLRLVLQDDASSVLPDGLERPYFAAFFDPASPPTPGNAYLEALVAAVAVAEPPPEVTFDVATVELLDAGQAALTDAELLEVAEILELEPVAEGPAA